jgi:heme/copper-type cytochrome/quinol oxidase subunit 2
MKSAWVLWIYAVLVVCGGAYAFFSAPPEANRMTAVMIPGVIALVVAIIGAVIAALAARAKRAGTGTAGGGGVRAMVIVAMVVLVLVGAMLAMPAMRRGEQLKNYPAAVAALAEQERTTGTKLEGDARREFFRARQSPNHDTTYLVTTLWGLFGLTVLTIGGLAATWPRR